MILTAFSNPGIETGGTITNNNTGFLYGAIRERPLFTLKIIEGIG